jgi:hypothetical protein
MLFFNSINVPVEIVSHILCSLADPADVGRFGMTCKDAHAVAAVALRPKDFERRYPTYVRRVFYDALFGLIAAAPRPGVERFEIQHRFPNRVIPFVTDPVVKETGMKKISKWSFDFEGVATQGVGYFKMHEAVGKRAPKQTVYLVPSSSAVYKAFHDVNLSFLQSLEETVVLRAVWPCNYDKVSLKKDRDTILFLTLTGVKPDVMPHDVCVRSYMVPSVEAFELLEKSFCRTPSAAFRFLLAEEDGVARLPRTPDNWFRNAHGRIFPRLVAPPPGFQEKFEDLKRVKRCIHEVLCSGERVNAMPADTVKRMKTLLTNYWPETNEDPDSEYNSSEDDAMNDSSGDE